jgi:GlpG protein
MRPAGNIRDRALAQRFGDFLYWEGIENQIDPADDGGWEIWILDDDRYENAKGLLAGFNEYPDDPVFVEGARDGSRKRTQDRRRQRPRRNKVIDSAAVFYRPPVPHGVLTVTLIGISVLVAVFTGAGEHMPLVQKLLITEFEIVDGGYLEYDPTLPEMRRGQVWRLFSPAFLHFGILHILFNMLWLRDLGSLVEARKGVWFLLGFFFATAIASNVAQFIAAGPYHGGMSGVVYGLFGYVWMQGRYNPASNMKLQKHIVVMMVAWFFLCLSGAVGNIGNAAHGVGAGVGIAWGYISAKMK